MTNVKVFDTRFAETGLDDDGQRTVLVTGGAGFIGSNLCHRLVNAGDRVICVDNLETGRTSNIEELFERPNFWFFEHDIIEPFTVSGPIDRIYNLACPGSPPKYQRDPIHTLATSVVGGMNLLEIAKDKTARILQSSTSEVYGDPDVSPQSEDYRGLVNTIGPRACYDEGKRAAETLFYDTFEQSGVDVRIARVFNTYGPLMDPTDGRVVSNFLMQSLQGQPLTVYGDGQQSRSFCYISDLLDGLELLMECDPIIATIHAPVNLGNPGEFTVMQLADLTRALTNSNSEISYHAMPKHDPRQRRPDITRAGNLLGWAPKVPLLEGLRLTIPYFRKEIEKQRKSRFLHLEQVGGGGGS